VFIERVAQSDCWILSDKEPLFPNEEPSIEDLLTGRE